MIDVPNAPKRLGQVGRTTKDSWPANRQSQGNRKSKSALRRYLPVLVLLLGWELTWAFGSREPRASNHAGEPGSITQSAQSATKPDTQCRASSEENPEGLEGRSPEASSDAVNRQVLLAPAKELEKQSAGGPPPEVWYERPSQQRTEARLEESIEPVLSPPVDVETGRAQVHPQRSRSAARSIALADLSERLPPSYFGKDIRAQSAAAARQASPPPSPEPTGRGEEDTEVARKSPSDKPKDPGQSLGFSEIPSQMRDSIPMSISMLVYSKNVEERWAKINGVKLQEGQEVSTGLKVEAITPEGIIFDYQGTRFYKAVKED
jgi:hypothetical protein